MQILATLPTEKLASVVDYLLFLQSTQPTNRNASNRQSSNGHTVINANDATSNGTQPQTQNSKDNPWLRFAGEWGDEAEWAQFQADIAANRKLVDAQTLEMMKE